MGGRDSPWNGFWGLVVLGAAVGGSIVVASDKLVRGFKPAADKSAAAVDVMARGCVGACPTCGKPKPCSVCSKQLSL